jgi:hypothetical protein
LAGLTVGVVNKEPVQDYVPTVFALVKRVFRGPELRIMALVQEESDLPSEPREEPSSKAEWEALILGFGKQASQEMRKPLAVFVACLLPPADGDDRNEEIVIWGCTDDGRMNGAKLAASRQPNSVLHVEEPVFFEHPTQKKKVLSHNFAARFLEGFR